MKLVRMRTLGMLGIGFLAGSRAGRGPWEKAQESMGQIKGKVGGSTGSTGGGTYGSTSSNGMESQRGTEGSPALTEM
jgi:hypothetical protein